MQPRAVVSINAYVVNTTYKLQIAIQGSFSELPTHLLGDFEILGNRTGCVVRTRSRASYQPIPVACKEVSYEIRRRG